MIGTVKILPPEINGKTPPEGYGPLVHTPTGLETLAKGLLSESEGVRALFKADGYAYLARLEQHPLRYTRRENSALGRPCLLGPSRWHVRIPRHVRAKMRKYGPTT